LDTRDVLRTSLEHFNLLRMAESSTKEVFRIFLGGLPATISVGEIQSRFEPFGEVISLDLPREKFPRIAETPLSRGFAFISLCTTSHSLHRCIATYTGCVWKGNKLRIGLASPDFAERSRREAQLVYDALSSSPCMRNVRSADCSTRHRSDFS